MLPASSPNKFAALSKPIQDASVTTILVGVVVVAALYFGREVLVPIALAVLHPLAMRALLAEGTLSPCCCRDRGRSGGVFRDFWIGDLDGFSSQWSRARPSAL